ncbi:hypothetical protein A0O32_2642 [Anoxybacillus flavithermus]|nr:hypothetical protein A0O32_2642 [Anoxybacillus flavithermus]
MKARHRNTNSFVPLIVFHFNFGKAKGQLRTVPGTVRKEYALFAKKQAKSLTK